MLVSKADLHVTWEITLFKTDREYLFAQVTLFLMARMFAKLAIQVVQLAATQGCKTV